MKVPNTKFHWQKWKRLFSSDRTVMMDITCTLLIQLVQHTFKSVHEKFEKCDVTCSWWCPLKLGICNGDILGLQGSCRSSATEQKRSWRTEQLLCFHTCCYVKVPLINTKMVNWSQIHRCWVCSAWRRKIRGGECRPSVWPQTHWCNASTQLALLSKKVSWMERLRLILIRAVCQYFRKRGKSLELIEECGNSSLISSRRDTENGILFQ